MSVTERAVASCLESRSQLLEECKSLTEDYKSLTETAAVQETRAGLSILEAAPTLGLRFPGSPP